MMTLELGGTTKPPDFGIDQAVLFRGDVHTVMGRAIVQAVGPDDASRLMEWRYLLIKPSCDRSIINGFWTHGDNLEPARLAQTEGT